MMKGFYYNEDQSQSNTDAVEWLQQCGISFLFELHLFVFSITSSQRIQRGLTYTQDNYLWVLKLNCCIPNNWLSLDLSGEVNWKAAFPKFLLCFLAMPWSFVQKSSTSLCTVAVLLMFGLRAILVNSIYLYDHCFCFECGIQIRSDQAVGITSVCCSLSNYCSRVPLENSSCSFLTKSEGENLRERLLKCL